MTCVHLLACEGPESIGLHIVEAAIEMEIDRKALCPWRLRNMWTATIGR